MMTPKLSVTCDTSCTLPPEHKTNLKIPTISCTVKTDRGEFLEGAEITTGNILTYMERTGNAPQLIPPTAEDYRRFFSEQQKENTALCHFSVSSKLSPAYSNACEAAAGMKNVFVVDTMQMGSGMSFHIMQGARLASEGFGAEFIKKSARELNPKIVNCYAGADPDFMRIFSGNHSIRCDLLEFFERSPCLKIQDGVFKHGSMRKSVKTDSWKKFIKNPLQIRIFNI